MSMHTARHRHRWWIAACAAVLAVIGGLVAVTEVRIAGDLLERDGLEAFYTQPADALSGDPGSIVKSEPLLGVPMDTRAWRIMYRSTDLHGDPVVATGVVVTPLGPAPAGGRTVVSWGHPTTGSAASCAPSRSLDPYIGIEGMRVLLDRGYTVVATDYTGMGTEGPDSYLIGVTEGHNVLDAVRAAQAIPAAEASSDVVLWGHSQGGQAVLFAAELAEEYAPELDIRAVAAAAPAADLKALMKTHLDDISGVTIGSYAFTAFSEIYADRGADIDAILTPEAVAIQPQMNALCLLTHIEELHEIAGPVVGTFTSADPTTTEPWATLLEENSAGGTAFGAPLLIVQGLDDELVRPADTEVYVEHAKSLGMDVTYRTVRVATHGTIAYLGLFDLVEFLDRAGV
ncbi:lipase family protein [Microbacterium sp. SSM24]|uniref:lipase family protein n=1 Tax=Microbacterium sp. SSM24 TaxID=2991714 RepID=UPI002226BB0A|nr:lipase family protein [Microbacterium sp. SSM24]MCW3494463.1 lipase family protein [Microbacterium sp. SSM24]